MSFQVIDASYGQLAQPTMFASICYYATIFITLHRTNERIGKYRERNPLLVQSTCTKKTTAMHLAIEMRKPERALILLKETGGKLVFKLAGIFLYVCIR